MKYSPINLCKWTRPESYFGAEWPDYYSSGVGQSRDSDSRERSNFICMLRELGGESETVIIVRESHWAVGWVEWIAIHESGWHALAIADKIVAKIADYPAIDEDHWSNLEYDEICSYWAQMPVRERAEYCARAGLSIFAARRDYLPNDDDGALYELLRC